MQGFKLLIVSVLLMIPTLLFAADKTLFYQLESPAGIKSYLFGTMHTDDNRVTDFSPAVIDALKQSDTFMMEVAEAQDASLLTSPEAKLRERLNEAEFDQLRALVDFHVMHLDAVVNMKPWILAFMFSSPKPHTPFAQDNLLKSKAEELYKDVQGIEPAAEHFGVMDQFSMDEQMLMLKASLKRSQADKEADFERLMAAYLSGDAEKVVSVDSEMTASLLTDDLWKRMCKVLLEHRNAIMAERTMKVAQAQSVFIAVGAAHLAGKTGLVQAYQQAGFTLTPLKK